MFCYQCQEAAKNTGCTVRGVCGKDEATAAAQDLIIYTARGVAFYAALKETGASEGKSGYALPPERWKEAARWMIEGLFTTITNGNFDTDDLYTRAERGQELKKGLAETLKSGGTTIPEPIPEAALWTPSDRKEMEQKAKEVGVMSTENEDIRSLQELVIYGCKGIAAYAHHADVLGKGNDDIAAHLFGAFAAMNEEQGQEELTELVLKTGETAVKTMALLDEANTSAYGHPEMTEVNLGVGANPGILISGHDLKDMEELLEQTRGTGVDVYTHGEMLPAHYYPAFKKYDHFIGNYGGSWWMQDKEFASFNGPILMTTNCITPVKDAYKDRIFTTGAAGYPDVPHIADRNNGSPKDFSDIIELAKKCPAPTEIETGTLTGGFAHQQVFSLADTVVDAVKSGAIKKFVVMAGCDGRHKNRHYFTEVAEKMPKDYVILTAGCAKYRYNKLDLGDIGGVPRVLDAGQCNDSYSLAVIALKLKEVFGLDDINELPIEYDIAWYEQKAVAVLLALLSLGVKNIRLGPTLPAFLSPNVTNVLVDTFNIQPTTTADADVAAMAG
jgi:hydroxylamine reductase